MIDDCIIDDRPLSYDPVINEIQFPFLEEQIINNPDKYYSSKKSVFYKRSLIQQVSPIIIKSKQLEQLKEIAQIFKINHTNFKIVISPLYDQIKLNHKDLELLLSIFGEKSVFDYSGINDITSNKLNYYESSHYRLLVARLILLEIYKNEPLANNK